MKQSLLCFLLAIVSFLTFGTTLNATVTTVTFTTSDFTPQTAPGKISVEKDGVSIAITNGLYQAVDDHVRIYSRSTTTVSSATTITKIVFTCTAAGEAQYGPGCFEQKSAGSYACNEKVGTWTGGLDTIKFTASKQVRATQIAVTIDSEAEVSNLKAAGLAWSKSSYSVEVGSEFTSPTFSKVTTATVSFSSDNKEVATVDANGVISLAGGVGTATITASSEKNETYDAGTATVTITTYSTETYSLATKVVSGKKYILVAQVGDVYKYAKTVDQGNTYGYLNVKEATVEGEDLKAISGNEITITGEEGSYTLTDALGRKMWMGSSYTSFQLGGTNSDGKGETWSISFAADGTATITNVDRQKYIQYSTKYFSFGSYATTSGVLPYLYEVKSETAIKEVNKTDVATDGVKYNILGQKVGDNYKGLVISNGKLQIVK